MLSFVSFVITPMDSLPRYKYKSRDVVLEIHSKEKAIQRSKQKAPKNIVDGYHFTKHASKRMRERKIDQSFVLSILKYGTKRTVKKGVYAITCEKTGIRIIYDLNDKAVITVYTIEDDATASKKISSDDKENDTNKVH